MIGRVGEKTKGDESKLVTILRYLLGLVGVVVITISKSLPKFAYLRYLRFALKDNTEGIDCAGNAFTGGNIFMDIGFFL